MTFRAALVAQDALQYFLLPDQENIFLRVSDILVRVNLGPEIFSRFIRLSTNSQWSHAALLYLMNDPREGFDNMFVLEAMNGAGVRVVSWNASRWIGIKSRPTKPRATTRKIRKISMASGTFVMYAGWRWIRSMPCLTKARLAN